MSNEDFSEKNLLTSSNIISLVRSPYYWMTVGTSGLSFLSLNLLLILSI
jgi:hypothetical protein